jgi:putative FmdB family regulatory protein
MPLYEYRCEACGQPEEKLESLSAPEVHACASCGAPEGMRRQVSVAAFTLAGGGWYKGAASEPPTASAPSTPSTPKVEAPKSGHGCAAGGCGCPLAG